MLDKFWESLGDELTSQWIQRVFSLAFLFWAGGLGIYILRNGWLPIWQWVNRLQLVDRIALLIVALIVLILSSLIMQHLRFTVLRLLEGYWPWPLGRLANRLSEMQNGRFESCEKAWNTLKTKEAPLTTAEARNLAELELNLQYFPAEPGDIQPTSLGNILRAGETSPTHKYGLDAFVCWPRLWLLLPEVTRQELSTARQSLMDFVELWAWGLLFLIWVIWSPWALLVNVLWMGYAYTLCLQAAMAYADLLEAAFDLHRWALYKTARWPLPQSTGKGEILAGHRLTEFLWRGTGEPPIQYVTEDKQ